MMDTNVKYIVRNWTIFGGFTIMDTLLAVSNMGGWDQRVYNLQRVWKDKEVRLLSLWGRAVSAFYPNNFTWKRRGLTFTLTYREYMGNPSEFVSIKVTFVPAPEADKPWERRIEAVVTVVSHPNGYFLKEFDEALSNGGLRYHTRGY